MVDAYLDATVMPGAHVVFFALHINTQTAFVCVDICYFMFTFEWILSLNITFKSSSTHCLDYLTMKRGQVTKPKTNFKTSYWWLRPLKCLQGVILCASYFVYPSFSAIYNSSCTEASNCSSISGVCSDNRCLCPDDYLYNYTTGMCEIGTYKPSWVIVLNALDYCVLTV